MKCFAYLSHEVIARINASRRHRDITALGEPAIDARAFAGQSMLWRPDAIVAEELERVRLDARLTPLQADLATRVLRFARWEGPRVTGEP